MSTILYPTVTKSFPKMMAIVSLISLFGVFFGAALGCAIIAAVSNGTTIESSEGAMNLISGLIFGLVSGMMTWLVLGSMFPGALSAAQANKISRGFITACVLGGALLILSVGVALDYLLGH